MKSRKGDSLEQIQIPAWVFEAFDLPAENRNFDYNEMLSKEGKFVNHWRVGASVPDIRENVLCDGHMGSGGFVRDGKLLFDFVSFPGRIKEIIGDPQKGELKKFHLDAIYGRTEGGITPSGWTCDRAPYIVELDNFGISEHPGTPNLNDHFVCGFNEISWFTNEKPTVTRFWPMLTNGLSGNDSYRRKMDNRRGLYEMQRDRKSISVSTLIRLAFILIRIATDNIVRLLRFHSRYMSVVHAD